MPNKQYNWAIEPFDHQADFYWWAQGTGQDDWKPYLGLFAEQGMGKSKMIIDCAMDDYINKRINGLLIIAPNDVHKQWYSEQIPLHCNILYIAGVYGKTYF